MEEFRFSVNPDTFVAKEIESKTGDYYNLHHITYAGQVVNHNKEVIGQSGRLVPYNLMVHGIIAYTAIEGQKVDTDEIFNLTGNRFSNLPDTTHTHEEKYTGVVAGMHVVNNS